MDHGGSIYTLETNKCYKSGLFSPKGKKNPSISRILDKKVTSTRQVDLRRLLTLYTKKNPTSLLCILPKTHKLNLMLRKHQKKKTTTTTKKKTPTLRDIQQKNWLALANYQGHEKTKEPVMVNSRCQLSWATVYQPRWMVKTLFLDTDRNTIASLQILGLCSQFL